MEDIAARRAAEWLLAEHRAGHHFKTLGFKTLGSPAAPATVFDAYDIQDRYVALLRRENGEPAGCKIGLTSATMQAFCRIDHPIGGVVLTRRVHQSGATIRRSDFGRLGLEFEIAQFPGMQCGTRQEIALVLRQQMPDQDGQLARRRDSCHMLTPPGPHPKEKSSQGTWRSRCCPGRLNQHTACMSASLLRDPPMVGRPRSGLPDAWI